MLWGRHLGSGAGGAREPDVYAGAGTAAVCSSMPPRGLAMDATRRCCGAGTCKVRGRDVRECHLKYTTFAYTMHSDPFSKT